MTPVFFTVREWETMQMAKRFVFRQIQFQDIAIFLKDGEIRAPNHPKPQKCHQASYSEIKTKREHITFQRDGSCINDYVQFYFSPITAYNYAVCKGIDITPPPEHPIVLSNGKTTPQQRLFIVCEVDTFRDSGLDYLFSNTALNTTKLRPRVSSDLNKLEDIVNWKLFDELPHVAQIVQIGYEGAHRSFHNLPHHLSHLSFAEEQEDKRDNTANPTALPEEIDIYPVRKSYTMAEFLIKNALPLSFIKCLVIHPNSTNEGWLQQQLRDNGCNIPIYKNADFFFNLP